MYRQRSRRNPAHLPPSCLSLFLHRNHPLASPSTPCSRPHRRTVPSMSRLTSGITTPTTAPTIASTTPHPARLLLPNMPAAMAQPNHPVVTISRPCSKPRMQLAAAWSGVWPPSSSSSFRVTAGLAAFSAASEGEKIVAGKRTCGFTTGWGGDG